MAHIPDRYKAAPLMDADTWRISDTHNGTVVSVIKGRGKAERLLAQLNGEELMRQGTIAEAQSRFP